MRDSLNFATILYIISTISTIIPHNTKIYILVALQNAWKKHVEGFDAEKQLAKVCRYDGEHAQGSISRVFSVLSTERIVDRPSIGS